MKLQEQTPREYDGQDPENRNEGPSKGFLEELQEISQSQEVGYGGMEFKYYIGHDIDYWDFLGWEDG